LGTWDLGPGFHFGILRLSEDCFPVRPGLPVRDCLISYLMSGAEPAALAGNAAICRGQRERQAPF